VHRKAFKRFVYFTFFQTQMSEIRQVLGMNCRFEIINWEFIKLVFNYAV